MARQQPFQRARPRALGCKGGFLRLGGPAYSFLYGTKRCMQRRAGTGMVAPPPRAETEAAFEAALSTVDKVVDRTLMPGPTRTLASAPTHFYRRSIKGGARAASAELAKRRRDIASGGVGRVYRRSIKLPFLPPLVPRGQPADPLLSTVDKSDAEASWRKPSGRRRRPAPLRRNW